MLAPDSSFARELVKPRNANFEAQTSKWGVPAEPTARTDLRNANFDLFEACAWDFEFVRFEVGIRVAPELDLRFPSFANANANGAVAAL